MKSFLHNSYTDSKHNSSLYILIMLNILYLLHIDYNTVPITERMSTLLLLRLLWINYKSCFSFIQSDSKWQLTSGEKNRKRKMEKRERKCVSESSDLEKLQTMILSHFRYSSRYDGHNMFDECCITTNDVNFRINHWIPKK